MLLAVLAVVVVGRAACIDVVAVLAVVVSGERPVLMLLAVLAVVVVGRAACIDVVGCVGRGCGRASGLY